MDKTKTDFQIGYFDADSTSVIPLSLIKENNITGISLRITYKFSGTFKELAKITREVFSSLGQVTYVPTYPDTNRFDVLLHGKADYTAASYIGVGFSHNKSRNIAVNIVAPIDVAFSIEETFDKHFVRLGDTANATWFYANEGRISQQRISLDNEPQNIYTEFYPFLNKNKYDNVEDFINQYLNSSSSVLMLAGPPGTGKTSLLRHMLQSRNMSAYITYDRAVLESDNVFIQFLTGEEDVFIIEDADLMVESRENHANNLMQRFLNASDGLIRLGNKKLIFTNNLNDFSNVDEALLRPGRCFDCLMFRKLTAEEADAAAKKIGIDPPGKSCTLAELFNPQSNDHKKRKVGFG